MRDFLVGTIKTRTFSFSLRNWTSNSHMYAIFVVLVNQCLSFQGRQCLSIS